MVNADALDCGTIDGWNCGRTILLAVLCFVSAGATALEALLIFRASNNKNYRSYQQLILYVATLQMVLGMVHWAFASATTWLFALLYLKQVQLTIVAYIYTRQAIVLLHRVDLKRKMLWPIFSMIFLALSAVFIVAATGVTARRAECTSPSFIELSSAGMVLAVLFALAGWFVTSQVKRHLGLSARLQAKRSKELWILAICFCVTNAIAFVWDVVLLAVADSEQQHEHCDVFLEDDPAAKNIVNLVIHIVTILVPVWAEVWAFRVFLTSSRIRQLDSEHQVTEHYLLSDAEQERSEAYGGTDGVYGAVNPDLHLQYYATSD
jgi:hypothetical protein